MMTRQIMVPIEMAEDIKKMMPVELHFNYYCANCYLHLNQKFKDGRRCQNCECTFKGIYERSAPPANVIPWKDRKHENMLPSEHNETY